MGNCFGNLDSTAEIAPYEYTKKLPVVRVYGSPGSTVTSYIRFALHYKPATLEFIPSESPISAPGNPVVQLGSETVSGSIETLLQYIEARFPHPLLRVDIGDDATPVIVVLTRLQHRSMMWHMERVVRWGNDLATRGGRVAGNPTVGSPRMEVKKLGKNYSQLLEVMLEHAQMEERVVFPILEMADRGVSKVANEEHARDLPMMNGIKEDMKSIGVLDAGSLAFQEALIKLSIRLESLQEHCKEHFEEEETNLLGLMEAVELSKEQQEKVLEQCLEVMEGTHSHLFRFFVQGLIPQDAIHYLDLIYTCCKDKQRVDLLFRSLN